MQRREFLRAGLATPLVIASGYGDSLSKLPDQGRIMTVLGPKPPSAIGTMLPHEHIMSTFGLDPTDKPDYNIEELERTVVPYLASLKQLGCTAIADCTAAQFGRAPALLRQISQKTGLHLLTNTGYYGAANDRYVPPHAFEETVDQLAARWIREWREGIDGTGIRPGFLKIGIDSGPLSAIDRKLVQAAARAHRASGLTIAVHTGDNLDAAREQLSLLRAEGVSPQAWIWVHAHAVKNQGALTWAAQQRAWISFDGLSPDSLDRHLELVQMMKRAGTLRQVLLSHDGDYFPAEGHPRPFDALFSQFIPGLRQSDFSPQEIRQLISENPRRAFTVRVRAVRSEVHS